MNNKPKTESRLLAQNRRAWFDYQIEDKLEAGIELRGTEVKSIRNHDFSFRDAYAIVKQEEIFLIGLYIAPFKEGNINNVDPERTRKLLLHRDEIKKLIGKTQEQGMTLIPLDMHWHHGKIKVELGIAKSKKLYDKRAVIKRREEDREMERAVRSKVDR